MNPRRPLGPETKTEIRKMVAGVSVSPELNPRIRAELADHVVDKVQAYVSGEEPVTEADALLITQAHFGPVREVSRRLRKIHRKPMRWNSEFRHRLTAASLAMVWAISITYVMTILVYIPRIFFPAAIAYFRNPLENLTIPHQWMGILAAATGPIALWLIYRFAWNRLVHAGTKFWFKGWLVLAGALTLTVAATELYVRNNPNIFIRALPPDLHLLGVYGFRPTAFGVLALTSWLVGGVAMLVLFFQNTVRPENGKSEIAVTFATWLVLMLGSRLVFQFAISSCVKMHGLDQFAIHIDASHLLAFAGIHDGVMLAIVIPAIFILRWWRGRGIGRSTLSEPAAIAE